MDEFLLRRGAQLMRQAAFSHEMADFIESEAEPGLGTQNDEDWSEWIAADVRHEYHPIVSRHPLPSPSLARSSTNLPPSHPNTLPPGHRLNAPARRRGRSRP